MVLFINGWATNQTIWAKLNLRQNSNFYDVSLHKSFSDLENQFYHLYKKSSHPLTLIGWSLGGMLTYYEDTFSKDDQVYTTYHAIYGKNQKV